MLRICIIPKINLSLADVKFKNVGFNLSFEFEIDSTLQIFIY